MHPSLMGKAATMGRNYTNVVTHFTRKKTLFESRSWKKKWGQAAKIWQNVGIVEPVRTKKLGEKKWGGGRGIFLTSLNSIQPVCGQKLGKRG